jgi:lysophospholipase L1-like esterase
MYALYRARARLLICAAVVVAFGALVLAPAAGATGTAKTYLALGDSLAYGYHQAQFQNELKEKGFVEAANFNDGYVDDFGRLL